MCPGTIPVTLCARAPFRCPNVLGHLSGARVCPATIPDPYVPGHHSGAHMCLGTIPVPMCPGNFWVHICARAPFRCPFVLGHRCNVHMFPVTIVVSIYARAPFRFPYMPGHPSVAHMCPGTILVHMCLSTIPGPICAQILFRCLYVTRHHSGAL